MPTHRRYQLLIIGFEHLTFRNTFIKHMANKFNYSSAGGSITRMLNTTYPGLILDPMNKVMDVPTQNIPETVWNRDHLCAAMLLEHDVLIQFLTDSGTSIIDMGPVDE